jgi:uncharacterized protein (DUF302 family)
MSYVFSKFIETSFDQAIARVREQLGKEGFGILSEIDVQATLKKKLYVDFRKYCILGACNPPFAHLALQVEPHIGALLPCNVIIQEYEDGRVEVAAVDPSAYMQAIDNPALVDISDQIRVKLQKVIDAL